MLRLRIFTALLLTCFMACVTTFPVLAQDTSGPSRPSNVRSGAWFRPSEPNKVEIWVDISKLPSDSCVRVGRATLIYFNARKQEVGRRTVNINREVHKKAKNSQHFFYAPKHFKDASYIEGDIDVGYGSCGGFHGLGSSFGILALPIYLIKKLFGEDKAEKEEEVDWNLTYEMVPDEAPEGIRKDSK